MVKDGFSILGAPRCLVNLDADPIVPEGYVVMEHTKGGIKELKEISLCTFRSNKPVLEVLDQMSEEFCANANFLDYLLDNPGIISNDWKKYVLVFGATIYQKRNYQFIRSLSFTGERWVPSFCSLNSLFYKNYALVLLK